MSIAFTELEPPPAQPVELGLGGEIERTAFYLESEGQSLFAWLHRPVRLAVTHGILLCPPLGHELVHSHRTLRHLAEKLASQGFAVLRIDYHGTGDSEGAHDAPDLIARWQANLRDSALWLRTEGGCQKVSLIGLRLGASLAVLHAAQVEVQNLVLWAPITRGKRYVRELTALSKTAALKATAPATTTEAMGFVFTDETTRAIAQIDLTTVSPRFSHGLIVHSESTPPDQTLGEHLSKLSPSLDHLPVTGYEEMMAEPQDNAVPHAALDAITQWMLATESTPTGLTSLVAPARPLLASSMVTKGAAPVHESIHRISSTPDLFGIICESAGVETNLPWIVMLNAGAAYRIGPGRLYVKLARQFAALGYPCLRMDISGIGDSEVDPSRVENDTYPATAFRDVALACDYLTKLQPQRRIILMGLCSGAYAAFQSAAQLPHPALVESIMLNPLTFFWKEGMTLADAPTQRLQAWHYYRSIVFDPQSWRRLLSGKTNMGFTGALRRFAQVFMPRTDSSPSPSNPSDQNGYSHPPNDDLSADLSRAVAASRHLAMVVSENDPGHFLLMHKARRKATQLIRAGHLQCYFINNADHTFSTESARESLSRVLTEHLKNRYGSGGDAKSS